MRKYYLIFVLAGLIVVAFVFGRGCKPKPGLPANTRINVDSIALSGYDQGYALGALQVKLEQTDSVRTVYVTKWVKYKAEHDTIEIVKECIQNCDSALNASNEVIEGQRIISAKKDTLINTWQAAYRGDSTNFAGYRDSIAELPNKFWKGFKWGLVAGNITGSAITGAILR